MAEDIKKMLQERDTKKVTVWTIFYNFCSFSRASVSIFFHFLLSLLPYCLCSFFLSHSLSLFSPFSLTYSCIESFLSTFISDFFVSHSNTFILHTVRILSSRRASCSVSTDTRWFFVDILSQILSP
jgi:hypothetical protein